MKIFPPLRTVDFDELVAGDLFAFSHNRGTSLALRTEAVGGHHPCNLVVLGPAYPYDAEESFSLNWKPDEVISYGKACSVILPADPAAWFQNGSKRDPVCLALAGDSVFVCANGGHSPSDYRLRLVEFSTGKVIDSRVPGPIAYTRQWEIAFLSPTMPPRTVLRFPAGAQVAQ